MESRQIKTCWKYSLLEILKMEGLDFRDEAWAIQLAVQGYEIWRISHYYALWVRVEFLPQTTEFDYLRDLFMSDKVKSRQVL